jgi:phosphopantetheinyl transferase
MSHSSPMRIAVVADLGQPLSTEWTNLAATERDQARSLPTKRRRRQYVLGRVAAREAIRRLVGSSACVPTIEILSGPTCAPRVAVNGSSERMSISISHSNRLAVGCAWLAGSKSLISAGVDLEYLRPNAVAESTYAFSWVERKLLLRSVEGPEVAALAAWTAKEAVWKALLADQEIGPNAIEVEALSLEEGCAIVQVKGSLLKRLGDSRLDVQSRRIEGAGGEYVLSLARVIARRSPYLISDRVIKLDWGHTKRPTPADGEL